MIKTVVITKSARKDLAGLPRAIVAKFATWVGMVETNGLEEVRKIQGFHDEPLKGKRKGQRSIRLSKSCRAFYVIVKGEIHFAEVREVNNHEY